PGPADPHRRAALGGARSDQRRAVGVPVSRGDRARRDRPAPPVQPVRAAMIAVARHAALAGWHVAVPAAVTALTLGYAIPPASDGWLVAGLVQRQPVIAAALVFVAAGAIVRTWSDVLPGAQPIAAANRDTRGRRIAIAAAIALAAASGIAVSHAFQTAR